MRPLVPVGFLLDTTALIAAYDNVQDAAYLVETARDYHRALYTSVVCLFDADVERPGLARWAVDQVDSLNPVSLAPADIVEIGVTLPGRDLATAHTLHQALPGRSWPAGRAVATTRPELYEDLPIPIFGIDV
ncbi:MAG: hypothetical protein ACRDR6_25825 [Pseudonocardiaceae bacterium]